MVIDPREDLLEKSVGMLDLNKDIVSVGRDVMTKLILFDLALFEKSVSNQYDNVVQDHRLYATSIGSRSRHQRESYSRNAYVESRTGGVCQEVEVSLVLKILW
jgi:hypothetical protein